MAITTNWIKAGRTKKVALLHLIAVSTLYFYFGLPFSAQEALAQSAITTNAVVPYGPNLTDAGQLVLGPGDLVDVTVFNTVELSGRFRVDQAGRIELPVGGQVGIGGLTPKQAAGVIEQHLRDEQIMLAPHVTILISQYATQGVTILGEAKVPGTYPVFGPHTLYDALALAGGPTQLEGGTITITHHNDPDHPIVVHVNGPNYSEIQRSTPVYPGDNVVISQADVIYVVGDVSAPGALPMSNGRSLSLLNVLALCRGTTPTAAIGKAVIIRQTGEGVEKIHVDINGAMKNTAPNPILQASDVLVVPDSGFKKFLQFALPSVTSSVSSAVTASLITR